MHPGNFYINMMTFYHYHFKIILYFIFNVLCTGDKVSAYVMILNGTKLILNIK